jgi:para-aminobenzoate synthetase component 1
MVTQEVELPVSPAVLLTRCAAEPFVFALDGGDAASWGTGRAVLGFRPRATLRVAANGNARMRDGKGERQWHGDPFVLLDRFCTAWTPPAGSAMVPCAGGVLAALSYELRHWVERLPVRAYTEITEPVLHAAFYDWLLSYSYAEGRYQLASAFCSRAELRAVAARLAVLVAQPVPELTGRGHACPVSDFGKDEYLSAVRAVLDYIAAGDVYQVNLAQRFVVTDPPAPAALFATLQRRHPVPFAAYVDGGDFILVSNSPECFLARRADKLATFPIKGTRRRGHDPFADEQLARELQDNTKERAEHLMIVDLERNDLGRVCRTGSVQVEEFARIQTFPTLHHLVSKVSGQLRPRVTLAEVLRATFPGGSITGAPKIRAMEIIDEIEPVSRSFYTGAIGLIDLDGDAVFNLAIRTAVATRQKLTYHAGGGIVADSVPIREYEETLLKAQPFFAALARPTV